MSVRGVEATQVAIESGISSKYWIMVIVNGSVDRSSDDHRRPQRRTLKSKMGFLSWEDKLIRLTVAFQLPEI